MYPISQLFDNFLMQRDNNFLVRAEVGNEDYGMSNIVDFAIESKLIGGEEFEIGTVVLSRLVIKLRLKGEVPPNARIVPYVAFDTSAMTWEQAEFAWQEAAMPWSGGASEWMPLGEFYVDSRTRDDEIWRFECVDKLIWSERPYASQLTYPATMQAVWDEICGELGYTYDSTVRINPTYTVPAAPAGYTCREIMGFIAGANSASVRAGKDGQIQFKRFAVANMPDMDLTASDYIRVKQINPIKQYTRFVVEYDEEQELTHEAGSGTEDQTLYISNPLMTQAMVNDLHTTLGGFIYQPMEMDARGYPHIDVGDEIGYEVYEGSTWEGTVTPWQDTNIPWNGLVKYGSIILTMSMRYSGGFKMMLDAPSKSDQQSEYVVEGTITKQVKQLNKDAVKLGRNYYGVTTSREEGLVVEIEGGDGKAVLNADELTFWADGERALWFDVPNRRWKFTGTLEGADGTFSGTLSAATIIGSNITGGTISGTVINGGSIYGAYIATSMGAYPFVEFSSSNKLVGVYGAADRYVKIEADPAQLSAPVIKYGFQGAETWTYQVGSTFFLYGPSNEIQLTGNRVRLGNIVNVGGLTNLKATGVDIPTTPEDAVVRLTSLILVLRNMGILA